MLNKNFIYFLLISICLTSKNQFDNFFNNHKFESINFDQAFDEYEIQFNKNDFGNYKRKKNLINNLKFIKNFNYHSKHHKYNYELGLNEFSDMDWKEFSDKYLMKNFSKFADYNRQFKTVNDISFQKLLSKKKYSKFHRHFGRRLQQKKRKNNYYKVGNYKVDISLKKYPQEKSWKNNTFKIKHQIKCASCYAFSALAAVEISYHQYHNKKIQLSEQEIIDCDKENDGCVGGDPALVLDYINQYGISTLKGYPYIGEVQDKCQYSEHIKYPYVEYYAIEDPVDIIIALQYGPVIVGFHASEKFKQYKSGVYDEKDCNGKLNHSVVIIGYNLKGSEPNNEPYIVAKNSWGKTWGDKGYFKIALKNVTKGSKGICKMFTHELNIVPTVY